MADDQERQRSATRDRLKSLVLDYDALLGPLRELRELCETVPNIAAEAHWRSCVQHLARDLARRLAAHFALEEASDHFGAIALGPGAAALAVGELKNDHATILELVRRMDRDPLNEDCVELSQLGTWLFAMMDLHESIEAKVVTDFLRASEGSAG